MDLERVLKVIEFYDATLERDYLVLRRQLPLAPEVARTPTTHPELQHLRYMIGEMRGLIREGRTEKAMRWLGFLQGVLWSQGVFTLEAMKNHSRPDYGPPVYGQCQCRDPQNCGVEGYQCGCRSVA